MARYSLTINRELNKQSIAITVRLHDEDMSHLNIKRGKKGMQNFEVRLHGASNLSKHSYCLDCNKPILDVSRTKKKARCNVCRDIRIKKITKIHSERIMAENRAKTLEKQRKLEKQKL